MLIARHSTRAISLRATRSSLSDLAQYQSQLVFVRITLNRPPLLSTMYWLSPSILSSVWCTTELFVDHLGQTINPNCIHPRPLLFQVDGQGGTGQSCLNHEISVALNSRKTGCTTRASPTGIAANAIDGATLHSMLRLPISKQITPLKDLRGNELVGLQNPPRDVSYIIIDEKSMIGLRTF